MSVINQRDRWAQLRFLVIGSLLHDPPSRGELKTRLQSLADKTWAHPVNGTEIRFKPSSIERWYYLARDADDPVAALRRRPRARKQLSLPLALTELINSQYQAHPGWTVQLHYDNLKSLCKDDPSIPALPSYATVRRYFRQHALVRLVPVKHKNASAERATARRVATETRSFETPYANACWHLDFHDGSRRVLNESNQWITPQLLAVLDDHSRLCCHAQWYEDETGESLVHGFSQALAKFSLPRALVSDNAPAMISEEFTHGLLALSTTHRKTLFYSPQMNGKQERFWGTLEKRLMPMLENQRNISLDQLNHYTLIWVERDYNRRIHQELEQTPLDRYANAENLGRNCPDTQTLREAFCTFATRRQRRNDGTISLEGTRFEIPGHFHHLHTVHLRYAR